MDELKQRLEYLENIGAPQDDEASLLEQVDTIGSALNLMLDVHQQEAGRLAGEVSRQSELGAELGAEPDAAREPTSPGLPPAIRNGIVASRFASLARLADELEAQQALTVPEIKPPPNMDHLIAQATELGREFDQLTLRSAELTKMLADRVADDNEKVEPLASA